LSDEIYRTAQRGWAPVGAQYRHVLEHYEAFLRGVPDGRVNYDERPRDQMIEASRSRALAATQECLAALERLSGGSDGPLMVQMDVGGGPEAPDWRASSVGRELQFLLSHTVHHYALIKLLLADAGPCLDTEFGVAPSTLSYLRAATR
jgi:hypothetical protein